MRCAAAVVVLAGLGLLTVGCVFRPAKPDSFTTRERIEAFAIGAGGEANGDAKPGLLANHAPLTIEAVRREAKFVTRIDAAPAGN